MPIVDTLDRRFSDPVTARPAGLALAFVLAAVAACTTNSGPDTSAPGDTTSTSAASTTTAVPPPTVDLGVDLEAGVLRLGVVGEITDDRWSGHLAYWDSVNDDLGGVGGRFEVELVAVDTLRDALAVGVLAVSIDAGDDPGVVQEILVADQDGQPPTTGRLPRALDAGVPDI